VLAWAWLLCLGANPTPPPLGNLAVGAVEEHGRGVRGHGQVLSRALAFELSRSGAFTLVADARTKSKAADQIRATNRLSVDESQWVQIGQAAGATHLLLGEVRQEANTCSAFAQLVHLESRSTQVSRPEYYDCTRYDLVALAGDLAEQLSGRRATARQTRAHRRPPEAPPIRIVMRDREAIIDGHRYVFYDGAPTRDAGVGPEPAPTPPAADAPTADAPAADAGVSPAPAPAPPEPPRAPTGPRLDPQRWPGLTPAQAPDGAAVFNLYALGQALSARAPLVSSGLLALPLFFVFVGALLLRARPTWAPTWLRAGFNLAVLALAVELAVLLFYRYALQRPVTADADGVLLAAPILGVVLWLAGARLLGVVGELRLLRHVLWLVLLACGFAVVLLLGSQLQVHVGYFGAAFVVFWLGLRLAASVRRRRLTPAQDRLRRLSAR
jgi:TolB-like protein